MILNLSKTEAQQKIAQLVERFNEHIEEYKRGTYNEHQTRVDYINPFFKALGWDIDNAQGFAEYCLVNYQCYPCTGIPSG